VSGGWDERYAAVERLFSSEPDPAMVHLVAPLPPARAVDLGAGEGRNALWLARQGWTVTAVDSSAVALERLTASASAAGLRVIPVLADVVEFLGGGETFELVVIANLHPSAEERAGLLRAAAGAVSPGGRLFLVGHHLDSLGRAGPPDPGRLYTEASLEGALPGLTPLLLERRERVHGADTGTPAVDLVLWAAAPGSQSGA
jgi:SAM-dependent methyltransferase